MGIYGAYGGVLMEKFCQSCGMPMDQDPGKGGTNKDGTKSGMYCSYCYENGDFKDDFTEASQMVDFVKVKPDKETQALEMTDKKHSLNRI